MISRILIPVAAMAALGLVFGVGLAYALKIFGIKIDPEVEKIFSRLPGSNCGACGRAGCAAFAQALKNGEVTIGSCVVNSEDKRRALAGILGLEHAPKVKTVATVLCNGGAQAKDKFAYRGIQSCRAATLVFGGQKTCSFGCLGFGDCRDACPFGAISIGSDLLPLVDGAKCTSCGKCVTACPKKLYKVLPVKTSYYVKCSSKDPGAVTARACKSGCIACLKCESACPVGAVKVRENLSEINPGKCQNIGKCFEACPTKVIVKRST